MRLTENDAVVLVRCGLPLESIRGLFKQQHASNNKRRCCNSEGLENQEDLKVIDI